MLRASVFVFECFVFETTPCNAHFVTDVIPASIVSDHDAQFACINVRVNRYQPRYKYIRNMKTFDEQEFISDLDTLPLNIVYSSDDPDEQLK